MYDAIVDHAINNVWCAPLQDYEHTIMPARLSPAGGWLRYGNVIWNPQLPLPHAEDARATKRYHVYQIGKYPDFLLGVPDLPNRWINLNEIMDKTDCFVSCFIDSGITLRASESWLRLLKPSNNIVLAVQIDHDYSLGEYWVEDAVTGVTSLQPARLDYKQLFIRFYTNARLKTLAQRNSVKAPDNQVEAYSKYCTSVSDVNAFIADTYSTDRPEFGWMRVDGYVVTREWMRSNPFTGVGKTLYAYHDDTIIGKYWFKLNDLKSFRSIKDPNIDKYIMFYGRDLRELIYHNDVEYFMGIRRGDQFKAVYVPRFTEYTVTNITHAMHALDTNVVADIIDNNPDFLAGHEDEIWIRAIVRQGGMVRGLTYESNRIESLYRMTDEQILQALQDRNSVMPEWRAENLENSWYNKLMSAPTLADITPDLVMKAYGYNAMTKYMQPNINLGTDMPAPYKGTTIPVSNALTRPNNESDLYLPLDVTGYTTKGLYLDHVRRLFPASGEIFLAPSGDTLMHKAEIYVNNYKENRTFRLTDTLGAEVISTDLKRFGFGCYVCPLVDGQPNFNWVDVTDSDFYTYDDGNNTSLPKITWDSAGLLSAGLMGMVRINNESAYLTGKLSDFTDDDRGYTVLNVLPQDNGYPTMMVGQIDLWVAGVHLFQDLDFFLDWPKIYICKQIIDRDSIFTARISGLPHPKTKLNWKSDDFGFVKSGILGVDKPYRSHHDKNIQINVMGEIKLQSEVQIAEDPLVGPLVTDGVPFACTDYVTPIEFYTGHSTLVEKMKAVELDERVNAYLGLRVPLLKATFPVVARGERWNVVSIFFNELLCLLKEGWMSEEIKKPYTNVEVTEWVKPYQYLLKMDIIFSDFFDPEYVSPIAHSNEYAVEVSSEQMTFLRYISDNYLEGKVELEKYLYITVSKE